MGLKKYIFGTLLLTIILFGYTFSINSGDYRLQVLDYAIVLPVAVWVIAPMVLLFILSVLHIIYYGLKNYFSLKAITKDFDSFKLFLQKKLLKQTPNSSFSNSQFKELYKVLSQLDIQVNNKEFSSDDKEITKIVDQIFAIESGKYIPAKELKIDSSNPLAIKNLINRVSLDDNFAIEVLKNSKQNDQSVVNSAFYKVLENKSFTTLKKYIEEIQIDTSMLLALLKKDSEQNKEISMANDLILKLILKVKPSNNDLIKIVKIYKSSMNPDQLIKLFEDLMTAHEETTVAYLYVLSEFEMIDKMRDILVNSQNHEYIPFKALIDLKDNGKHTYSVDTLCFN
ncbi:MAG: hypothetical protein IE909_00680 [Campylobacterales bacterium]|nr:hypothetical protein [Campylobacterales bacterium]